jgi:electron transfer flavoprotein beta subunit
MAYNSIVLVKQVPDTAHISGKAMKDDGTVNRAALPAIFNPEDLNALEMALQPSHCADNGALARGGRVA